MPDTLDPAQEMSLHERTMLLCINIVLLLLISHTTDARPNHAGWTPLPALPEPRQEHSVVALDDNIYILGGTKPTSRNGLPDTVATVEYYSLTDNTWHTSTPFLQPLNHLNAAVVAGKIYILGGLAVGDSSWDASDTSMVYSHAEDTWTPISPMPQGTARGACAVGVYGGRIFLAGGMTYLNDRGQDVNGIVSVYDTVSDSWDTTSLPPLPQPRQHVGGAVVGSTFYVLGGRMDGQLKIRSEVFAIDLERAEEGWRQVASMGTARGGLACGALGGKIVCMGGEGNPNSEKGVFGEVEVYDPDKDEWRRLVDMPVPRHGWGVAAVGDTIYVPGGGVRAGTDATDYFDAFTP